MEMAAIAVCSNFAWEFTWAFPKAHFKKVSVLILLAFTALYYFFVNQGMDTPIGSNSAYICQVILSATSLILLLGSRSLEGFSLAVGYLKCVGTGMNTVMMMLHYPENRFLHAMGIIAFVMDVTYIAYFLRMRRSGALPTLQTA